MKTPTLTRTLRTGLFAAAIAALVGGAAIAPAFADGGDWHRGGDRHEQSWHDHDGWRGDHAAVYVAPGTYAAPAYGYGVYGYAYVPAPALNLGVTIR
jgi:hypothetical protein